MRLLANENLPRVAVEALRARGHDVVWVRTDRPGSLDPDILAWANAEERVLLTFDKDFGELAFRRRLGAQCGVILLRFSATSPVRVTELLLAALEARTDWVGHFSVIEEGRIRMTALPRPASGAS